jgi:cysteine desulfurase/selenocysteine lyase
MTDDPKTLGRRVYFDNGATSFPKPPGVLEAMTRYATTLGASPGRAAFAEAVEAGKLMTRCRERLNRLINGESPKHIIFGLNTSDALNLAIRGITHHFRRHGEPVHLLTSRMEHNSILRPFNALASEFEIEQTRLECERVSGRINPDDVRAAIRPDTRLVALGHGSNVTGVIQPIEEIGAICRERNVPLLIDSAQTLGHMPIDVQAMRIDLLAFAGHKGLLGPLGTGGIYIRPGMEEIIDPVRQGGTGVGDDWHPTTMPAKFEAGSPNAIGIIGLSEGIRWLLDQGVEKLWAEEKRLIRIMLDGLRDLPGLTLLGSDDPDERCGVFALNINGFEPAELSALLEDQFGILTRSGIHCAPLAHEMMGTKDNGGAVRLSLGPFMTEDEVRYTLDSIAEICRAQAEVATA